VKHPAQAGMLQPQQIPTPGVLLHWVGLQPAWTTRTLLSKDKVGWGQGGQGFEQHGLVEDIPAHCRAMG